MSWKRSPADVRQTLSLPTMTEALDRLKSVLADRYAIEREIGAGAMATVYLADDLKHRRKVAVKVLRPELAASIGADQPGGHDDSPHHHSEVEGRVPKRDYREYKPADRNAVECGS